MNGWFITVLLILLLVAGGVALYQRIKIALLRSKLEDAIHTNAQTNTYLNMHQPQGLPESEHLLRFRSRDMDGLSLWRIHHL